MVAEQPRLIFGYQRLQDDVNAYNRDLEAGQVQQFPVWLPNPWGLVLPSFKRVSKDITGFGVFDRTSGNHIYLLDHLQKNLAPEFNVENSLIGMSPVVQDVSSWTNTTQLDLGIQHSIPCAMEHISTEDFVKALYNWEVPSSLSFPTSP